MSDSAGIKKRLIDDNEFEELREKIASARSIDDLPELDDNILFTQHHVNKLFLRHNPFILKFNSVLKKISDKQREWVLTQP